MLINVNLPSKNYDVVLERGLLNHIKDFYDFGNSKVLVITDNRVPSFYSELLLKQIKNGHLLVLKQGEESKSFENFMLIQKELISLEFTRHDYIVSLGGGVIGDLSAFASSTYKRGIKFVNIPTTSLSQIDSSVGGKTAINFMGVKNVIGTFYQPEIVLIDFDTLKTLSTRHLNNGLVEALKMGLILDEDLFELFKGDYLSSLEEIITRSIQRKVEVVQKDEKENHYRMILNFGHTIGHAIESIYNLKDIYHGEAVANGMLYMIDNSSLKEEVKQILQKMNIPLIEYLDVKEVNKYLSKDKKMDEDKINIIVVNKCGSNEIIKVTKEEVIKRMSGEK